MKTLWTDIKLKNEKTLNEDLDLDILIIGGGIAGLSNAFYLKDSNLKIALIEKNKIGLGATSKSTAKITFLQELCYQKIEKVYDFNTSKLYYESQKEALNEIKKIITNNKIKCDFMSVDDYNFTNNMKYIKDFKKEEEFYKKVNEPIDAVSYLPINWSIRYGIKVQNTAVFHPLKFLYGIRNIIKNNIAIYENTCAHKIEKENNYYVIKANKNKIKAKKIIVCTHYPFFIKPGFIPFKSYIEKTYVIASKTKNNKEFSAISYKAPIHSIRYHKSKDNYLIYATASHNITKTLDLTNMYNLSRKRFKERFDTNIDYQWVNQDIISNDYLPFIGKVNEKEEIYIATGFNTWGMTNGWLSGKIISDIILNNNNKYIELFKPNRKTNITKIFNSFINELGYLKVYVQTFIKKNYKFYRKNVKVIKEENKYIGIYTDLNGNEHRCNNLCPHMKCHLIFNNNEKTWDCPCHGSRFNIDGNLIESPSNIDLKN